MTHDDFMVPILHQCWVSYQLGVGQDYTDDLTPDQRASLLDAIHQFTDKPNITAEEAHESWWAFKRASGWTYGPEKDGVKRTHPDMVPYAQLPAVERLKDTMFLKAFRVAHQLWLDQTSVISQ